MNSIFDINNFYQFTKDGDMQDFVSTVFVDFGAINTGVVLFHGSKNEEITNWDRRAFIVSARKSKTFAMTVRRQKRHHKRNIERRFMAKRLLRVIVKDVYRFSHDELNRRVSPNQTLEDFFMGLLNRRGYTYATDASSDKNFELLDFHAFKEICENCGMKMDGRSFEEHFAILSLKSPSVVRELLGHQLFTGLKQGGSFPQNLELDTTELKTFKSVLKAYQKALENIIKAVDDGHKTRSTYLKDIKDFLLSNSVVTEMLNQKSIHPEAFINLVGNISNLQLRPLRRYFNDPSFKAADKWVPDRLFRLLQRYARSFHVNNEDERIRRREFLNCLTSTNGDVIKFLQETDPLITIPPFEDQNNRRPPKCQSLILDATQLDKKFPQWRDWERRIQRAFPQLVVQDVREKSNANAPERVLQRFLERSASIDKFSLREISKNPNGHNTPEAAALKTALGLQQIDDFLKLCRLFYQESNSARRSIWAQENPERLLRVCNLKTPSKNKTRENDLGRILRIQTRNHLLQNLETLLRDNPVVANRMKLKGIVEACAKMQKTYQNNLKEIWLACLSGDEKPDFVDKADWTKLKAVVPASNLFAQTLGANSESISNPWSLAAIHQILADRDGHAKICRDCAEDNYWRSLPASSEDDSAANATQLPADSVRPFDGVIAKLIQEKAEIIAREKAIQIEQVDPASVEIDVVIEENFFSSTEEMLQFKSDQGFDKPHNADKLKKIAEQKRHAVPTTLLSQSERIKAFSMDVCPYQGTPLGNSGEIDHIIPRSFTIQRFGNVLNHEANLLFVSQRGNQAKGNRLYSIGNLSKEFIQKHYPNLPTEEIETTVQKTLDNLIKTKRIGLQFSKLSPSEQRDLRFSLFFESTRQIALKHLIQINKVVVNGTQRYLAKEIRNRLLAKLQGKIPVSVNVRFADPVETSAIRMKLAEQNERLTKRDNQPLHSHIVDATIGGLTMIADRAEINDTLLSASRLIQALPPAFDIFELSPHPRTQRYDTFSSSVFKDSMYSERFIPVWLKDGAVALGFNESELLKMPARNEKEFWTLVSPFLRGRNGRKPPTDLAQAKARVAEFGQYYTVDKDSYFNLASELALAANPDPNQLESCLALEKIRYFVRKANFFETAWPNDKTSPLKIEELPSKYFSIQVTAFGIKGSLTLPAKKEWETALKKLHEAELPSKKGGELTNEFKELAYKIFNIPPRSPRQPVRKVFSLPLLDSPSGGFRLKRGTPNSKVYQVQATHAQVRGRTSLTEEVFAPLPGLISKSTTPIASGEFNCHQEFIAFHRKFDVPLTDDDRKAGILSAQFRLGTKTRPVIEVEVSYETLAQLLDRDSVDPWELSPTIRVENLALPQIFNPPRDNKMEVIRVSSHGVTLRYERNRNVNKRELSYIISPE